MTGPLITEFYDGERTRALAPVPAGDTSPWPKDRWPYTNGPHDMGVVGRVGSGVIDGFTTGWRFEFLTQHEGNQLRLGRNKPNAPATCEEQPHEAPVRNCWCGYRVVRTLRNLRRYIDACIPREYWPPNAVAMLLMQVSASGRYEPPGKLNDPKVVPRAAGNGPAGALSQAFIRQIQDNRHDPRDCLRVERYAPTPGGNLLLREQDRQAMFDADPEWERGLRSAVEASGRTLHVVPSFAGLNGGWAG